MPNDKQELAPGIYAGLSMENYLAAQALSASVLKAINAECPRKAWAQSWLNPEFAPDYNQATDRGTIAHALLLEGDDSILAIIDPNDHPAEKTGSIPDGWTNKSIRAARDAARVEGKIPVLKSDGEAIVQMVDAAREFILSLEHDEPAIFDAFGPTGASEETIIWMDGHTPCKLRADRRSIDWSVVVDYKTTARSVEPGSWGRTQLVGMDYYISAAWYRRGIKAATGVKRCDYLFLAQEDEPPYLCSLIGVNPELIEIGDKMVENALALWQHCVAVGRWPAYPTRACYPDTPAYLIARWMEQEAQQ
jgi:hypothetical protein